MSKNRDYMYDAYGPQHHQPAYAARLDWGNIVVSQGAQDAYELQPHFPTQDPRSLEPQYQSDTHFHWGTDRHTVLVLAPHEQLDFQPDNWFKGGWSLNKRNGEPFSVSVAATDTLDGITESLLQHQTQQAAKPIQVYDLTIRPRVRENVRRGLPGELGRKAAEIAASAHILTEHDRVIAQHANKQRLPQIAYGLGAGTLELTGIAAANSSPYSLPVLSVSAVALGIAGLQHLGYRTARTHKAIAEGMRGKPVEASYLAAQIRSDFLRIFAPDLYNQRAEAVFGKR